MNIGHRNDAPALFSRRAVCRTRAVVAPATQVVATRLRRAHELFALERGPVEPRMIRSIQATRPSTRSHVLTDPAPAQVESIRGTKLLELPTITWRVPSAVIATARVAGPPESPAHVRSPFVGTV